LLFSKYDIKTMGSLAKTSLAVLLIAVLVDWSSAWVCLHPATACHIDNHDEAAHSHTHDHGPLEHSHDNGPGHVQHPVKLLGVLVAPAARVPATSFAQPAPFDQVHGCVSSGARPPAVAVGARIFPAGSPARSSGKSILLMTERWLS
jgi:hypothetical protein